MEHLSSSPLPLTIAENAVRAPRPVWRIALACGAAAAILSWIAGELTHNAFQAERVRTQVVLLSGPVMQPNLTTMNAADFKNAILSTALLGGVMGLTMGFAGGLAGRSIVRGIVVGLIAAAIGGSLVPPLPRCFFPSFIDGWHRIPMT